MNSIKRSNRYSCLYWYCEYTHLPQAITMLISTAAGLILYCLVFSSLLLDHKEGWIFIVKYAIPLLFAQIIFQFWMWVIIPEWNRICLICRLLFKAFSAHFVFIPNFEIKRTPKTTIHLSSFPVYLLNLLLLLPFLLPHVYLFLSNSISHSPHRPLHKSWDSSALMDN